MVGPDRFIPLAEETGLIIPIGRWVLDEACRQLARWSLRAETAHLQLAVNISARQFQQRDFVEQVLAAVHDARANPAQLKLELTESLLVRDVEDVIAKMTELRATGIRFALDDFGTGYSSLALLKRLPLDELKIDKAKNEPDESVSDNAVQTVLKHMDAIRARTGGDIQPLEQRLSKLPLTYRSVIQNNNLNPADYDVVPLNAADQTLRQISGVKATKPDGTPINQPGTISEGIYLRSKISPQDDRYIVAYNQQVPSVTEDGTNEVDAKGKQVYKIVPNVQVVNPANAAKNIVSYEYGDKGQDKAAIAGGKAGTKMNDYLGGGAKPSAPSTQTAPQVKPEATKTVGGKTYNKINGKWYEQ